MVQFPKSAGSTIFTTTVSNDKDKDITAQHPKTNIPTHPKGARAYHTRVFSSQPDSNRGDSFNVSSKVQLPLDRKYTEWSTASYTYEIHDLETHTQVIVYRAGIEVTRFRDTPIEGGTGFTRVFLGKTSNLNLIIIDGRIPSHHVSYNIDYLKTMRQPKKSTPKYMVLDIETNLDRDKVASPAGKDKVHIPYAAGYFSDLEADPVQFYQDNSILTDMFISIQTPRYNDIQSSHIIWQVMMHTSF